MKTTAGTDVVNVPGSDGVTEFGAKLRDPLWRLNHLYWIQDAHGNHVLFKMNSAQLKLYNDRHYFNVILKARQLGISTLICLMWLDTCLFKSNTSAGIIAQTREDSEDIFKRKIKYPWQHMHPTIKARLEAPTDNARELEFRNGSSLRVGTSMRGSTLNLLLVSEYAKICAKYPDRALEIKTGSFNTVHTGQQIMVESTAEGDEGDYYEMCRRSQAHITSDMPLTPLDFKFFFFPWWENPEYQLDLQVALSDEVCAYFKNLYQQGIRLTTQQTWWYAKKAEIMRDHMKREFPSTPDEAFQSSGEGRYFTRDLADIRSNGQIGVVPFDKSKMVITGWDLGVKDYNAIWFLQVHGPYLKLIDYVEGANKSIAMWVNVLDDKSRDLGYRYDVACLPHDGRNRAKEHPMLWSAAQIMEREHGMRVVVTDALRNADHSIDLIRRNLPQMFIDERSCSKGLKALANYKREWSTKKGGFVERPEHDGASHGTKALETLLLGLAKGVNRANMLTREDIQKHNSDLMVI